jgi:hypothetical protein
MIVLLLFGDRSGKVSLGFGDPDFLNNVEKTKNFQPLMVFNIAVTLYGIGEELSGGILKDLDMKHFLVVTELKENLVLVMGLKDFKKNPKKVKLIKQHMDEIHSICLKVQSQIASHELFTNQQIKEQFVQDFKEIPILKKEFRKLDQIILS